MTIHESGSGAEVPFHRPMSLENFRRPDDRLHRQAGITIGLGVVSVLLGVYALFHFVALSFASMGVLGFLLLAGAVVYVVQAFQAKAWNYTLIDVMLAALFAIAGIGVLRNPLSALAAVTLLLGSFYMVSGIVRILAALAIKPPHMVWSLVAGVCAFLLGAMVAAQWPTSSFWLIGLLIGVDLIVGGVSLMVLGRRARRAASGERMIGYSSVA